MDPRLLEVHDRMQKAVQIISSDLSAIRTGRAAPSIVENIVISAYGGSQKLKVMELGTISSSDPKTLVIQPWDTSTLPDIHKGIMEANIGLSPVVDSNVVRISFPPLTEERRMEFIKLLKQKIEAGKVMIRQVRHDKMSELKRGFESKEITEDERRKLEEELQKMTDELIGEIENIGNKKEQELIQL